VGANVPFCPLPAGAHVPYVVNTNSARQVEFTARKSSHTDIQLTHSLATERVPGRLQSAAFCEPLLLHILHNEKTISKLLVDSPYVNADRTFLGRCVAGADVAAGVAGAWLIWQRSALFVRTESNTRRQALKLERCIYR